MSIRARSKSPVKSSPVRKPAAKARPEVEADGSDGVSTVHVQRSYKIPGNAEFESIGVTIGVTAPNYDEASAAVDNFMVSEFEKASEQFRAFSEAAQELADEVASEDAEEGEDGEDAEEGAEEGEEVVETELDEDAIRGMDRSELVALIKSNELDIDYKSIRKTPMLAEAVIEAMAEEGIDEETLRAMDRKETLAFAKEQEIDIDPTDFAKNAKGLSKMHDAIIEALSAEGEEEGGEEEEGEEDGEAEDDGEADGEDEAEDDGEADGEDEAEDDGEEEGGDAEEEPAGYTRAELEKLGPKDLKAIWTGWEIPGKFPEGSGPVAKKKAINRIMSFQDTGK